MDDHIKSLAEELIDLIRQPEYLYGSRRWGWLSYVRGDLEVECSSTRAEYRQHSIMHPEFMLDYIGPWSPFPNIWPKENRVTKEEIWFTGDAKALEREVILLRLSA